LGQLALKTSPSLIQKYAEASDFKSNHLDKVSATDAFVDFLSSPEFANVTSNEVSNFILYKDVSSADYVLNCEEILMDFSIMKFSRPRRPCRQASPSLL
jgi:hypothetical protein